MSYSRLLQPPTRNLDINPRLNYLPVREILDNALVALHPWYERGIGRSPANYIASQKAIWERNNAGIFDPANPEHCPVQAILYFPPPAALPVVGATVHERDTFTAAVLERKENLNKATELRQFLYSLFGEFAFNEVKMLFNDRICGILEASFEELVEAFDSFAILRREDMKFIENNKFKVQLSDAMMYNTAVQELSQYFKQFRLAGAPKSEVDQLGILSDIISAPALAGHKAAYLAYTQSGIDERNQTFNGAHAYIQRHAHLHTPTERFCKICYGCNIQYNCINCSSN
jgi:hypothetical protein